MIDKNELLFVVDENNNPLEPKPRHEVHSQKLWHRTAHVYIINKKKQLLCQKRSRLKDSNPGKWENFFGGHVLAGENYQDAAAKEVSEELGLNLNTDNLIPFKIHKNSHHPEFRMMYKTIWNGDIDKLQLEAEEVEKVQWFDTGKLRKLLVEQKDQRWVLKGNDKEVLDWIENDRSA